MKILLSKNISSGFVFCKFYKFRYHFDALAEANDAQNNQNHIVDKIESIPINSLIVQR